jgi:SAM-dependent methyltransferase
MIHAVPGAAPFTLGHHVLGIEGLALLRDGGSMDAGARRRRVREIAEVLAHLDEAPYCHTREAPPVDTVTGYAAWATSYDGPGNVTVKLEGEVVRALVRELPPAVSVLDAACGTGRHTAYLVAQGHDVVGIDTSSEMLAIAREKVPGARFETADLDDIPLGDGCMDAVVCALALSHARDIRPAIAELARVLRPGGRLIVSNPHPLATSLLGWRATVTDASGRLVLIPEYPHRHGECIAAFREAGLRVDACIEPSLDAEQAADEAKAGLTEAYRAALGGLPVVIVWDLRACPRPAC